LRLQTIQNLQTPKLASAGFGVFMRYWGAYAASA